MTSPLAPEPLFNLGPLPIAPAVVSTWVLMAALVIGSALATRRLAARPGRVQALLELFTEAVARQIAEVTQASPRPYLPFLGTLFTFLAVANASAIVPGLSPPTAQVETPAALALCVFFAVHVFGVRQLGARGYLRTFAHPSPLMAPFHVLSHLTRTFSLTIRLFGNVMSGEFMLAIVLSLAGLFVPIPLMAFEVLVGLVQAYIFSVLAAVFLGAAVGAVERSVEP